MTDQNAYINAYVDNSVGMLHEYVTMILQLRTQNKIANDMVAERDVTISSLYEEIKNIKEESKSFKNELGSHSELINRSRSDAQKWEHEYNELKSKVSHMDNLTSQMNSMKKEIIAKNKEIELLKNKLDPKPPSPKKSINTPKEVPESKREEPIVMKEPEPEDKNDDF
jgi:chromosome segregation ATPase